MALSKNIANKLPAEVASTILHRSGCAVKVGACLVDRGGVFEIGWNSAGHTGFGEHAEVACFRRALKHGTYKRAIHATMYVAAVRSSSGNVVTAKPCLDCQEWTSLVHRVMYRDYDGYWKLL